MKVNLDSLVRILQVVGCFAILNPEIVETDFNPLVIGEMNRFRQVS